MKNAAQSHRLLPLIRSAVAAMSTAVQLQSLIRRVLRNIWIKIRCGLYLFLSKWNCIIDVRNVSVCYTYIHTFVRTYVLTYARTHARTYVRTYVCMYVCIYVCMYNVYVCMYVRMYVRTYIRWIPSNSTVKCYEYNFCVSVNDISGECCPGLFGPENVLRMLRKFGLMSE